MKKIYSKPILKSTELLLSEQLLANSGTNKSSVSISNTTAELSTALGNEESEHDIWGNDDSSMWN